MRLASTSPRRATACIGSSARWRPGACLYPGTAFPKCLTQSWRQSTANYPSGTPRWRPCVRWVSCAQRRGARTTRLGCGWLIGLLPSRVASSGDRISAVLSPVRDRNGVGRCRSNPVRFPPRKGRRLLSSRSGTPAKGIVVRNCQRSARRNCRSGTFVTWRQGIVRRSMPCVSAVQHAGSPDRRSEGASR